MNIIDKLKIGEKEINNGTDIAKHQNDHFSSVGKKLADKIPQSNKNVTEYSQTIPREKTSLFMYQTNSCDISKLIQQLTNKYSSGYDNITNILLKRISEGILEPLIEVVNKSLSEGKFPEKMKHADVCPLYKSKDRLEKNNYRPISLLITLSKLLEKIVHRRTYNFLEKACQIYSSQYGFRTKHSCEQAVSELLSEIVKGHENKKSTAVVFLDLSKAFDMLSHKILYEKLERYGIHGQSLEWFKNYLYNRTMRVKCVTSENGTISFSDCKVVDYGTPQGSCLGPLIFLIFTNELYRHLVYTGCILFADHTTLYMTHQNKKYLEWCLEHDLKILANWFMANKLTLNVAKSVCMYFAYQLETKLNESLRINIDKIALPVAANFKFLGVCIDNKLTWQYHVNQLLLKLKGNTHLLLTSKNILNMHTKRVLYFAQIYSHLSYGIITWGNMLNAGQLHKLEKTHKKAAF